MIAVLHSMYSFFQTSKLEGSYFLLFSLSAFILYTINKQKNKWFMIYAIALIVLFVGNPISVWLLSLIFPVMSSYEPITVILPILVFIAFACAELVSDTKGVRQRHLVALALVLVISVCGNMAGFFQGNTMTEYYRYNDEKKEINTFIDNCNPSLVLADDDMLPFITSYLDRVPVLYGMDLWVANMDTGIMNEYDDEMYALHGMMLEPSRFMDQIASMGMQYGCDIIVIGKFDGAKAFVGGYSAIKTTDNYILYMRK